MAIIVPSKNIYDIKNSLIKENSINKIEVSLNKSTEEIEDNRFISQYPNKITKDWLWEFDTPDETVVFVGGLLSPPPPEFEWNFLYNIEKFTDDSTGITDFCVAGKNSITRKFTLKVPINNSGVITNKEKVNAVISRKIRHVEPYIGAIQFIRIEPPLYITANYLNPLKDTTYVAGSDLPTEIVADNGKGLIATIDTKMPSDNQEVTLIKKDNDPNFYYAEVNIGALRGFSLTGTYESVQIGSGVKVDKKSIVEYRPLELTISIYGKTYKLNQSDDILTIGEPIQGSNFSVETNPLMQSAYKDIFKERFEKTLQEYKNGKEIITLKCSISDYFDEDGNIVISAKGGNQKMSFSIYDEIIPMYLDGNNQENPISRYNNGTPKVFKVLKSKIYYDGAVWQEILAQEV